MEEMHRYEKRARSFYTLLGTGTALPQLHVFTVLGAHHILSKSSSRAFSAASGPSLFPSAEVGGGGTGRG